MRPITTFTYKFDDLPLAFADGRMVDAYITGTIDIDVHGIDWWEFSDDVQVRATDGSMIWLRPSDPMYAMVKGALDAGASAAIDDLAFEAYDRACEPDWDHTLDDRIAMREMSR